MLLIGDEMKRYKYHIYDESNLDDCFFCSYHYVYILKLMSDIYIFK